MSRVYTKKVK